MDKQKNIPKLRFPEFNGEWEIKAIGAIAKTYDGTHQTPNYIKSGVPFVSVENIEDIFATDKFISAEEFEKNFTTKPKKNDILMTRITAGIIGATTIVSNDNPLAYYVSLALIRIIGDVDVRFLNQTIHNNRFKRELHKRIIHVAFPKKINLGDIGKCEIALTSFPEQQKIASFFTTIDKKISQLKQKKNLLEKYKKGMMQKIFSQEIRFRYDNGKDFPKWEKKRLGEISNKKASTISANAIEDNSGDYPIYGATGFLKKIDFFLEENDYISIVKDGAGVGRLLYCEGNSSVLGTLDIIKPTAGINTYFLYLILGQIDFTKFITGSTIPHIYYKDYSNLSMLIPCLHEQAKIANFLTAINKKLDHTECQIKKAELWKKGLMQKMFV